MAVPSYDKDRIQPGYDRAEVESCLESLFDQLAEQYPDRIIIWSSWDHERWDRPAKHLCRAFGYSRGKELFGAFGYEVVEGTGSVNDDSASEYPNSEDGPAEDTDTSAVNSAEEDESEADETQHNLKKTAVEQKGEKRRSRNGITVGQILFILLFLATVFGVYWIVKFG